MNQHLQTILTFIQQDDSLSAEEKNGIIKSLTDANKELETISFELNRTKKVKHTTTILLEETIEELEQKRKAVQVQNRQLEIEASLERVRKIAMSMNKPDDMLDVCKIISHQLDLLNVKEIRNIQTAIFYKEKGTYMNYEYYTKHNKTFITETSFTNSEMHLAFAEQMLKGNGEVFTSHINGDEVKDWIAYQKTTNVFIDDFLYNASSLNYYWHSLGSVALGISTYAPLKEEDTILFRRFLKVFELAYRRYLDIEQAEANAREAKIEAALEKVRSRSLAVHKSNEFKEVIKIVFEKLQELGITASSVSINIFIEDSKDAEAYICGQNEGELSVSHIRLVYFDHPISNDRYNAWKNGEDFFSKNYSCEEKNSFFKYLFEISDLKYAPDDIKKMVFESKSYTISLAPAKNSMIVVNDFDGKSLSEKDIDVIKRFSHVFQQAYSRFNDLKKAEAQARESQIQLALERARTQSMIMQHSTELDDTLHVFHEQVLQLGIPSAFSFLWLPDESKDRHIFWAAWAENNSTVFKSKAINYPLDRNEPATAQCLIDWKSSEPVVSYHVSPEGVEIYFAAWSELIAGVEQLKPEHFSEGLYYVEAFMKYGCFGVLVESELKNDEKKILARFAIEFERAYTRFLDLQKAEAQAREAQIEAALERVRSRSMGMQKSEELKEVIQVVYDQFAHLNIKIEHTGFVIDYKARDDYNIWIADPLGVPSKIIVPYFDCVYYNCFNEAKEKGEDFFATNLDFEEKNKFYQKLFEYIPGLPEEAKKFYFSCPGLAASTVLLDNVCLYIENFSGTPYTDSENATLMRFGKVFQQTYTRFLDLQNAEAQAREATIEAALEKLRSRSLAMYETKELQEVVTVVFEKLQELGIALDTAGAIINIFIEGSKDVVQWIASPDLSSSASYQVPYFDHPIFDDLWKARESGLDFFSKAYSYEEKNSMFKKFFENTDYKYFPDDYKKWILQNEHYSISAAWSKHSAILIPSHNGTLPSAEQKEILKRFAKVFEQAYIRFLDLQKAEAQSRESQIELSLERVRAKTMAMHNSNDVGETAAAMVEELKKLGIETIRCGIGIMYEPGDMEVWTISSDENNKTNIIIGWLDMNMHPLLHGAFESWRKKNESYSYELKEDDLLNYYNAINNYPGYPIRYDTTSLPEQIHHNEFHFAEGTLFAFSLQQLTDEQRKIFKRVAGVFGQTYRRYLDLKKAEAQAREAQIEAALERVRSRTLAMQKSDELAETAAVLFKQLILLGIEPNRLYINIIKNETGDSEFWVTGEDGSKVSSAFESNMNGNPSFKKMYKGWKEKRKSLMIDMKGKELKEYFQHLRSIYVPFKDGLMQKRRLQYIAYFNKGFIGMASPDEQPEETVLLLERFAAVFNLTFTRFNDLKVAEAHATQAEEDLIKLQTEKKRAEDALTELKETQKQLVQSEKMASLGELTAGIAHEIQNPLNFVNNFSEVSKELLDEMKTALESGDEDEAREIVKDVIQNLEKINHHGKRADAIVKGMLQHSRQTSGTKEPTDINALCDEYLRLSYHSLRAKDKDFNADIKTDFDETIGNINIIPQDIGRVILNILTNAFYAVNEKYKKLSGLEDLKALDAYKPTVSIKTKKINDKIEIRVSDNGNGISEKIVDKIFQPFFTTKPTGQGTGLGLSMSYDIVKAHGGEIKVETKEGEWTEFNILLPM